GELPVPSGPPGEPFGAWLARQLPGRPKAATSMAGSRITIVLPLPSDSGTQSASQVKERISSPFAAARLMVSLLFDRSPFHGPRGGTPVPYRTANPAGLEATTR